MLPNNEYILSADTAYVHSASTIEHTAEGQHLACFAGGMYLLGGKVFSLEGHMEIGDRLTRGCAWAYDSFRTILMPERLSRVCFTPAR